MALPEKDNVEPAERLRKLLVKRMKPHAMKVTEGSLRQKLYEQEVIHEFRAREAQLRKVLGVYIRQAMPHMIVDAEGYEAVSGDVVVHLTLREWIQLLRECDLINEDVDPKAPPGTRTAVTTKEAFKIFVAADVDEPFPDDLVFCTSPSPVPIAGRETPSLEITPEDQEVQEITKEEPPKAASRRGSRVEAEAPRSRRPSRTAEPVAPPADRRGSVRRGSGSGAAGRRGSQSSVTFPVEEEVAIAPEGTSTIDENLPEPGTLYTLATPLTFQEAIEGIFRVVYVTQVKGTDKALAPLLVAAMEKLIALLGASVGPFEEAQAKAAHRVARNREIKAGGLTDEQQALVLELHTLVDEDGNGTVEKEELEAACGDKRGKMFDKLDVDANGHVDPQEFLEYFETMSKTRGRKAAEGLLAHVQKGVAKLKAEREELERRAQEAPDPTDPSAEVAEGEGDS
jgi:hypothetical protein